MTTPNPHHTAAPSDRSMDEVLVRAVREQLDRSANVDASAITVSVEFGVAHLDGEIATAAEDTWALHAAFRVPGISAAVDRLGVAHSR